MKQHDRISIDPNIMRGKPCIKDTRITVELILEKLGAGLSYETLLAHHPNLSENDILAAVDFVRGNT